MPLNKEDLLSLYPLKGYTALKLLSESK